MEKGEGKEKGGEREEKLHPTEDVPADPAVLEMFSDLQAQVAYLSAPPVGKVA